MVPHAPQLHTLQAIAMHYLLTSASVSQCAEVQLLVDGNQIYLLVPFCRLLNGVESPYQLESLQVCRYFPGYVCRDKMLDVCRK